MLADARSAVALPRKSDFVPFGGGLWDGRPDFGVDAVPFPSRPITDRGDSRIRKAECKGMGKRRDRGIEWIRGKQVLEVAGTGVFGVRSWTLSSEPMKSLPDTY